MRGLSHKERAAAWQRMATEWRDTAEIYKALSLYWQRQALALGAEPLPPISLDVPEYVPSDWAS